MRPVIILVAMILLSGCLMQVEGAGVDLPADGKALFEAPVLGNNPGCVSCHSLVPGKMLVGPSLAGIGSVAGGRVPGLDAERYLRQSIVDANAYIVPGFKKDAMPGDWAIILNDDQIDALVTYLEDLR
jgi:mono/diheme cytochrome c family protein